MVDSVTNEEFEKLIELALDSLPNEIHEKIDNVEIILEDRDGPSPHLLGLYQGVPQTKRGVYYSWVLPDRITIFKKTIERHAQDKDHLARIVKHVVRHEIAHYFGYSDEELDKRQR